MNSTQYMPFRFSDKETTMAHNVALSDFITCKNRYELKPRYTEDNKQLMFNGHPVYDLYKDGVLLQTKRIMGELSPDDDAFFSAIEFLTEYEEYTPQAVEDQQRIFSRGSFPQGRRPCVYE